MKRWLIALFLLGLVACSHSNRVVIDNREFTPAVLSIEVGEAVTWENESDEAHTVTAYATGDDFLSSGGYSSVQEARANLADSLVRAGDAYSFTFEQPGVYEYFCIPHEDQKMKGRVIVAG